jgi:hypothetical protein
LDVGLIEWTERLAQGSKDPPFSAKACPCHQSNFLGDHKRPLANDGATEGRGVPEGGQLASPRPASLARAAVEATQLPPTPGGNQGRPCKGGG